MKNKKWYESSYRRNLIDMHIPDWDPSFFAQLDPEKYVQMLKTANVDTAYIYTTSCVGLCNFPTKIGKMHEGLRGRDIIREITDGCRREGIRPVLYINMWSKWVYDTYPDWRCVSPEGKGTLEFMWGQPGRYGVPCPNSPYKEYVLGLVRELMDSYETDGLWIDMILWRTMCTCKHCRKRYEEETGYPFPDTIDMGDPAFMSYLHKREEWICEFADSIRSVVYAKNPDAAVICNSCYHPSVVMGMSLDFAERTEFIAGDANLGIERSFEAKLFNNVAKHHPFEFLCSVMDPALKEHSMLKTEEHLLQLMTSCLAHNGRNGFIDAIDPSGKLNPAVYSHMRKVYDEMDKYIPYLETDVTFCADAAIYTNFSNYYSPEDDGTPLRDTLNTPSSHMFAAKSMAERLVEHNIPYDVITPLSRDKFKNYSAILLPEVCVLSDQEVEDLRTYVKEGGNLYASGRCAVYDGLGGKKEEGRLADVLGVKLCGRTDEERTFIRPVEGSDLLPGYTTEHPLSCNTWQTIVEVAEDAEVLGRMTLPIVHPKDITKFASAISDPPGKITSNPSIVFHRYGKGQVFYISTPLENFGGRDHSALLARMVRKLMSDTPAFTSDAPHPVEITMYRQKESGRYVINLTNATLPVLTLADITVRVRIPEEIKSFYSVQSGTEIPYTREGEYVSFFLPRLRVFEMIVAEPAE